LETPARKTRKRGKNNNMDLIKRRFVRIGCERNRLRILSNNGIKHSSSGITVILTDLSFNNAVSSSKVPDDRKINEQRIGNNMERKTSVRAAGVPAKIRTEYK
jgi:hypothetical protein